MPSVNDAPERRPFSFEGQPTVRITSVDLNDATVDRWQRTILQILEGQTNSNLLLFVRFAVIHALYIIV